MADKLKLDYMDNSSIFFKVATEDDAVHYVSEAMKNVYPVFNEMHPVTGFESGAGMLCLRKDASIGDRVIGALTLPVLVDIGDIPKAIKGIFSPNAWRNMYFSEIKLRRANPRINHTLEVNLEHWRSKGIADYLKELVS